MIQGRGEGVSVESQGTTIGDTLEAYAARGTIRLSGDSSIPLYYQLYRFLKRFIEEGSLMEGERFPSEEAIASTFGVSRPTANRAVQELVVRDWLLRDRGRGTFVKDQPPGDLSLLGESLSLAEQFPKGETLETVFMKREIVPHDPIACRALCRPDDTPILQLRRGRAIAGHPVMVCDAFLEAGRFPRLGESALVRGSLYATLGETYGHIVERSERRVTATELIDQEIADLLKVALFSPALVLTGLTFAEGEESPIEYMVAHIREGISFANTVHRKPRQVT